MMENPEFNAIANCESSDGHAYMGSTVYGTLNPSAGLDQVRRSSGVIQVNPNLVRILSNVGGLQNVTVKQERKDQNLVPFEICEGDGLSTESLNLPEKPSCTVLTVCDLLESKELNFSGQNAKQSRVSRKVQQKEINLREKAHDSTEKNSLRFAKDVQKIQCKVMKQVKIVKKVKLKSDLSKPQFGVQIETKQSSCDPKCSEKLKPFVSLHGATATQNEVTSSNTPNSHGEGTNSLVPIERISPHTKDSLQLKVTEMQSSQDCRTDSASLNHLFQIPPVAGCHSDKRGMVTPNSSNRPGIEAFASPRPLCFSNPLVSNENNGKQEPFVKTRNNVTEQPTIISGTLANATLNGAQKLQSIPSASADTYGIYNTLHAQSGQASHYSTHAVNIAAEEVQRWPAVQGCHDQSTRISDLTVATADGAHKQHTSSALNKRHENLTLEPGPSLRIVKFPIHHSNSSTGMTPDVADIDTVKRPIENSHWPDVSKQLTCLETPYKNMKTSSHAHAFKAVHLAHRSQNISSAVALSERASDHSNQLVSNPSMEVNTSSAVEGTQKPISEVVKFSKGLTIYDCLQTAGLSLCSTTNVTDQQVSNPSLEVNASSAVEGTQKPSSEVVKLSKGLAIYDCLQTAGLSPCSTTNVADQQVSNPSLEVNASSAVAGTQKPSSEVVKLSKGLAIYDYLQTAGLSLCSTSNVAEKSEVEKLGESCAPCGQKSDHGQILQVSSADKVKSDHGQISQVSSAVKVKVIKKVSRKHTGTNHKVYSLIDNQCSRTFGFPFRHGKKVVRKRPKKIPQKSRSSLTEHAEQTKVNLAKNSHLNPLVTGGTSSQSEAPRSLPDIAPAVEKVKETTSMLTAERLSPEAALVTPRPVKKKRKKSRVVKHDSIDSDQPNDCFVKHTEIPVAKKRKKSLVKQDSMDSDQLSDGFVKDTEILVSKKKSKKSKGKKCDSSREAIELRMTDLKHLKGIKKQEHSYESEQNGDEEGDFCCGFCRKILHSKNSFKAHSRTHSVTDIFSCAKCGRTYSTSSCLQKHVLIHRRVDDTKKYQFVCGFCNKEFVYEISYKKHVLSHKNKNSNKNSLFCCEKCNSDFVNVDELHEHMRAKHHVKRYACTVCGRLFFLKSNFIEHRKTHEEFDDVSPDTNSPLSSEENIFEPVKSSKKVKSPAVEYFCKLCGKSFDRKNLVANHVRSKHRTVPILEAVQTPTSLAILADIDNLAEKALTSKSRTKKSENDSEMSQDLAIDFEDATPRGIVDSEVDVVGIDGIYTGKSQTSHTNPGKKRDKKERFRSLDNDPKNDITNTEISLRFSVLSPCLRDKNNDEEIVDVESLPQCDTNMAAEQSRIGKEQETAQGISSFFRKSAPFCDISTSSPEDGPHLKDSEIVCSEDLSLKPTKRSDSKLSSGTSLHGQKKAPSARKKATYRRSKSDAKKRLKKSKEHQEDLFLTDTESAPEFLKGGIQYYIPEVGEKEPLIEIHNGQCVISHFDKIKDVCTVGTEASSSSGECDIDHFSDMNDPTESTFLCELCSDILPSIDSFEKHLRIHIEKNQDALEAQNAMDRLREKYGDILDCSVKISAMDIFQCEICEKTFSNSLVLKRHSETHQNEQTVTEPSITGEQNRPSEDYTVGVIATKARRRSRKKSETRREDEYFRLHPSKMGTFPCEKCRQTFGAKEYLNKHMEFQHSRLASGKRKQTKSRRKWIFTPTFYCTICSKSFSESQNFDKHMKKHMDESYACEICGQLILQIMNIRRHVKKCHLESENRGKTVPEGVPKSHGKKKRKLIDVEDSQSKNGKRIASVV